MTTCSFFDSIHPAHLKFIREQKIFFVATAPLSMNTHINLSPKGQSSFRVLSPNSVAYMDFIGSGNETSAHLLENGRITFMFCAFDEPPHILRLYGRGRTVLPDTEEWVELKSLFEVSRLNRQMIVADIHKVQSSNGFGVPLFNYSGERTHMQKWEKKLSPHELELFKRRHDRFSIDGLPTAIQRHIEELNSSGDL